MVNYLAVDGALNTLGHRAGAGNLQKMLSRGHGVPSGPAGCHNTVAFSPEPAKSPNKIQSGTIHFSWHLPRIRALKGG
jgi:hypothetical protein